MFSARIILGLSCSFSVILSIGLISVAIFGMTNSKMITERVENVNLSSMKQLEKIRSDGLASFKDSGFLQTICGILMTVGCIGLTISALGIIAAISALKIVAIVYIITYLLLAITFIIIHALLLEVDSILNKSIVDQLVHAQNTRFVSAVALLTGSAGSNTFYTLFFNVLQVILGCCGMRTVGDIRNSPSWRSSSRSVADLLKLNKNGTDPNHQVFKRSVTGLVNSDQPWHAAHGLIQSDPSISDWIKDRNPPNTTPPPGDNLPDKAPVGIENSLLLQTPISCCKFKDTSVIWKFDANNTVKNLLDQDCPFSANNGFGVHNETCYKRILLLVGNNSLLIIMAGSICSFFMTGCATD